MSAKRTNLFGKDEIGDSADLVRILKIPRRLVTPEDDARLADELTEILRVDGRCGGVEGKNGLCTVCKNPMRLRPIQGRALYELGKWKRLFGIIRVGGGKTLISLLAPFVVGAKSPILLLPASLIEKTEHERMRLAKHWRVAKNLSFISYEKLGRLEGAELLEFRKPDLILGDEGHRMKNPKAACTKRMKRRMKNAPDTPVGIFSGTMIKGGTIKAFAHLLKWTHKNDAPIPLHDGELQEWAAALDEGTNFNRPRPGKLLSLANHEDEREADGDELRVARRGLHRRLVETPGVVSTGGDQVACSLYVRELTYKPNDATDANFKKLRNTWQTPDGWTLSMATEVWRVARELSLGFHGVWDPRPPQEWLNARKEWAAFVRHTLSHSRSIDSELQVANACARGEIDSGGTFNAWQEIRNEFRIIPKDVWHDTTALEVCEKWMSAGPGIVWVDHVFFGEELARRTGVAYFREGGLDKKGNSIEVLSQQIKEGREKVRSVILSGPANQTGRNLQPWDRNLFTACPGAADLEQRIGRTHRDGQESDQVTVDILVSCIEHVQSWHKAVSEAEMTRDTIGDAPKILIADVTFPSEDAAVMRGGPRHPRWSKTRQEDEENEDAD